MMLADLETVFSVKSHKVVSHEEWLEPRRQFLAKEKEFTRLRDELNEERRALPWEKVEKGKAVYVRRAGWQQGCSHCSFWADGWNGIIEHLKQRDTTMIAISQALLSKIDQFRGRMGWVFKWVSSANTDFNFDYQASARPQELKTAAALSIRTRAAMFSTPIPLTRAGWICSTSVISFSI
jgi:predicted dithiol-disulfide oxidoreductase (DUF899 family)